MNDEHQDTHKSQCSTKLSPKKHIKPNDLFLLNFVDKLMKNTIIVMMY
jgi:hypothetical protein